MSKHQLTQLLNKGQKPYSYTQEAWFIRYNDVIEVYNLNQQKKNKLDKLYCPYRSYIFLSYLINNYLFNIAMVLTFIFLPLFNLILEILLISYLFFLKKQTKKHQNNLKKVQDPFQNFYYYPQMCQQIQKHFTTLNLTVEEIQNFKFNQTHTKIRENLLKNKQKQNLEDSQNLINDKNKKKSVKVPIYDQYFYDSFFLVKKEYFKAISWSILGGILLALSILFYAALYEDIFG